MGGFSLSLERNEHDLYKRGCCSVVMFKMFLCCVYQFMSRFDFVLSIHIIVLHLRPHNYMQENISYQYY